MQRCKSPTESNIRYYYEKLVLINVRILPVQRSFRTLCSVWRMKTSKQQPEPANVKSPKIYSLFCGLWKMGIRKILVTRSADQIRGHTEQATSFVGVVRGKNSPREYQNALNAVVHSISLVAVIGKRPAASAKRGGMMKATAAQRRIKRNNRLI